MSERAEPLILERLWAHSAELADGVSAETEYDDAGRPVRTVYRGDGDELDEDEEQYGYDEAGRLVSIDEAEDLLATTELAYREETGGRLTVEHDEHGPCRIVDDRDEVVWRRADRPWPELLAAGAATVAEQAVALVERHCAAERVGPDTEVFALMLTYVDQGLLHVDLAFGLDADRQAWLRAGLDEHELSNRLWYLDDFDGGGLRHIEGDVPAPDLDAFLLCHAAIAQPGDPYRVVLGAVAARLALHDWSGVVTPTEDFVVFMAEHDEGYRPKAESVRAANPPPRVAAWERRWPRGASRGDDEGR